MRPPGSLDDCQSSKPSVDSSSGVRGVEPVEPSRLPGVDEAWVGIGSNLGERSENIARALEALEPWLVARSPVYETAPWGIADQPWFLNLVAQVRWVGSARELLDHVLSVEQAMGRKRTLRFGPRCIDIDVLIVGGQQIREGGLVVPHPGIARRRSVLEPWGDLSPNLMVPGVEKTVAALRREAMRLEGQDVHLWSSAAC